MCYQGYVCSTLNLFFCPKHVKKLFTEDTVFTKVERERPYSQAVVRNFRSSSSWVEMVKEK